MRMLLLATLAVGAASAGVAHANGDGPKRCFDKGSLTWFDCPTPTAEAEPAPEPAPAPAPETVVSDAPAPAVAPLWTGPYVGAAIGGRQMNADWDAVAAFAPSGAAIPLSDPTSADFDDLSARVSAFAGYDHQISNTFVIGVEADVGYGDNEDSISGVPGLDDGAPSPAGSDFPRDGVSMTTSRPIGTRACVCAAACWRRRRSSSMRPAASAC